jgi:hypothetical protein
MAFDPENHEIDSRTGFMVHKDTGHPIGLVPPPVHSPCDIEWPKWVKVHDSHILRKEIGGAPDHVSVPAFPDFHVNRENGEVTVLVHDEDQEKLATSEAVNADEDQKQLPGLDEQTRREVHRDVEGTEREQSAAVSVAIQRQREEIEAEETRRRMAEKAALTQQNQKTAAEIAAADQAALDAQFGAPVSEERRRILAEEAARKAAKPPVT